MGVTYLLRHGRTELSSRYVCSGDPRAQVLLDVEGLHQCRRLATRAAYLDDVAVAVTSEFARTRETAELLVGDRRVDTVIEPRLNEIDYGSFEGGPWLDYGSWLAGQRLTALPPGGSESWSSAVVRMLDGLNACLDHPAPRLVVGHGLLVSLVTALQLGRSLDPCSLPEAPYVTPMILSDQEVEVAIETGHRFVTLDTKHLAGARRLVSSRTWSRNA